MRPKGSVAVLFVAAAGLVVVGPARNAYSTSQDATPPPSLPAVAKRTIPIPPEPGQPVVAPAPPDLPALASGLTLTTAERATVTTTVRTDPTVARLIGSRAYKVTSVAPWHTSRSPRLIGAAVILELAQPASLSDSRWPILHYDPAERASRPYRATSGTVSVSDASELMVLVTLDPLEVVGVDPSGPAMNVRRAEVPANPFVEVNP